MISVLQNQSECKSHWLAKEVCGMRRQVRMLNAEARRK